jgi:pyrroloquinoline quinone biosynthesis protein D
MNRLMSEHLPRRRDGVKLRREGDAHIVWDPVGGPAHLLNETALAIWQLCDGETSPQEMVAASCMLFAVDPDQVAQDEHVERDLEP